MNDDDDQIAAELLDEVDLRTVSIIWGEEDAKPQITFSGCSVYEALGMTLVACMRLIFAEAADDDDEETDE